MVPTTVVPTGRTEWWWVAALFRRCATSELESLRLLLWFPSNELTALLKITAVTSLFFGPAGPSARRRWAETHKKKKTREDGSYLKVIRLLTGYGERRERVRPDRAQTYPHINRYSMGVRRQCRPIVVFDGSRLAFRSVVGRPAFRHQSLQRTAIPKPFFFFLDPSWCQSCTSITTADS